MAMTGGLMTSGLMATLDQLVRSRPEARPQRLSDDATWSARTRGTGLISMEATNGMRMEAGRDGDGG